MIVIPISQSLWKYAEISAKALILIMKAPFVYPQVSQKSLRNGIRLQIRKLPTGQSAKAPSIKACRFRRHLNGSWGLVIRVMSKVILLISTYIQPHLLSPLILQVRPRNDRQPANPWTRSSWVEGATLVNSQALRPPPALHFNQKLQNPLITEYTLNHTRNPIII